MLSVFARTWPAHASQTTYIEIVETLFLSKVIAMGRADDGPNFCEWMNEFGPPREVQTINAGFTRQGMRVRLGQRM